MTNVMNEKLTAAVIADGSHDEAARALAALHRYIGKLAGMLPPLVNRLAAQGRLPAAPDRDHYEDAFDVALADALNGAWDQHWPDESEGWFEVVAGLRSFAARSRALLQAVHAEGPSSEEVAHYHFETDGEDGVTDEEVAATAAEMSE